MAGIDLGEEDGYVTVAFGGAEVRLDLFDTHSKVRDYHEHNKSLPDGQYSDGLVALMRDLGIGPCSHRVAQRFVERVLEAVAAVKKNASGPPGSPAPTAAPTPGG